MANQSEVALLRERIDLEIEALQQIKHGFARCASHEIIMNRYRAIDACFVELSRQIGEEAATDEVCERMNEIR